MGYILLYCINLSLFSTNVDFNLPLRSMRNIFGCFLTFYNLYFSTCDIQSRRLVTTSALLSIDSLSQRRSQLLPFRRSLFSRLSNIQEQWICAKSVCLSVEGTSVYRDINELIYLLLGPLCSLVSELPSFVSVLSLNSMRSPSSNTVNIQLHIRNKLSQSSVLAFSC